MEKTGTSWVLRASAEDVMRDVDYALEQLGTDYIDTIVLCRVPADIPIEEVVTSMKAVVDAGECVRTFSFDFTLCCIARDCR